MGSYYTEESSFSPPCPPANTDCLCTLEDMLDPWGLKDHLVKMVLTHGLHTCQWVLSWAGLVGLIVTILIIKQQQLCHAQRTQSHNRLK